MARVRAGGAVRTGGTWIVGAIGPTFSGTDLLLGAAANNTLLSSDAITQET